MNQPFIERLKFWLCDTLGHLNDKKNYWYYDGNKNSDCAFCGRVKSVPNIK